MFSASSPSFGPTCPKGGNWYACASGSSFVGCCATYGGQDPCQLNCAQGNLYAASFTASLHGTFPDASCESGSNFFTCNGTNPAFMGCCKTNPCATGCPPNDLTPAFLGTDNLKSAYGALSSGANVTSTLATTASGTGSAATATKETAATAVPEKKDMPVGAIAGGVVGGVVVLAVIIGFVVYYCCHAKKSRKGYENTVGHQQSDVPVMAAAYDKDKGIYSPEAPPGYVSPNPNDYYGSHTGRHNYQHQFVSKPQELPIEPDSTALMSCKPVSHQRNVSELSGDTAMRSELDTPVGSPHGQSKLASPVGSPHSQTQADWKSSASPQTGSNWVAHQSWQTQSEQEHAHGPTQGLGLHGISENETNISSQR